MSHHADRWSAWLSQQLDGLAERDLLRNLAALEPIDATHVCSDGRELVVFSSNDYLGLSSHPDVRAAAQEVARVHGLGPRGSPLVCGYTSLHERLEERLASLKHAETALLFSSGFAANAATLASLAGDDLTIFSDALNHASIIDGCRLAQKNGARLEVYPHRDVETLSLLLREDDRTRQLIVTDSVFSMDGDFAPLPEICRLAEEHGALVMIDEAHATLVHGADGGGLAEEMGVSDRIDIHVGTMSKAFGSHGGFVCTSSLVRDFLLNRGRPFVFSTALPLPIVAAADAALDVASDGVLRAKLRTNLDKLGERLGRRLESAIVPVIVGTEEAALEAARSLRDAGLLVPAIRPPTVPRGTSRLRVAISAAHTPAEIRRLADVLSQI